MSTSRRHCRPRRSCHCMSQEDLPTSSPTLPSCLLDKLRLKMVRPRAKSSQSKKQAKTERKTPDEREVLRCVGEHVWLRVKFEAPARATGAMTRENEPKNIRRANLVVLSSSTAAMPSRAQGFDKSNDMGFNSLLAWRSAKAAKVDRVAPTPR